MPTLSTRNQERFHMAKDINYIAEFDIFMQQFLKNNPHIIQKQTSSRSTWWEKDATQVTEELKLVKTNLKNPSYPYFTY